MTPKRSSPETVAVGDLDDEAPARPDQERTRIAAGNEVGVHGVRQHGKAFAHVQFPKRLPPFHRVLAAPDIVYQDVETAPLPPYPVEEGFRLGRIQEIDPRRYAFAAMGGNHLRGLFDRFRSAGGSGSARATSRAEYGGEQEPS